MLSSYHFTNFYWQNKNIKLSICNPFTYLPHSFIYVWNYTDSSYSVYAISLQFRFIASGTPWWFERELYSLVLKMLHILLSK